MKPKKPEPDDPVIPEEIRAAAKHAFVADSAKPAKRRKCDVCSEEVAPNSTEDLCWVCRRLKISAWGEGEQQMPASE